tara:strand:- start:29 stop:625 length:597 start_codon:yes stop_codon:yes gene_type:complete
MSVNRNNVPTPKVSTMTYIGEIVETTHPVRLFYSAWVDMNIDDDLYIENKEKKRTKKGKFIKSFGNQLTIKSRTKNFNVKLFYNNRIQITGVKSEVDVHNIIDKLCNVFDFKIINEKMVMKNLSVKISHTTINLYKMFDKLSSDGCNVSYTPEIYPGLKFKTQTGISTALIFATGNVIISTKDDNEIDNIVNTLLMAI